MNDAGGMQAVETGQHLQGVMDRFFDAQDPGGGFGDVCLADHRPQAVGVIVHHIVGASPVAAVVEDGDDVGVADGGHGLRLGGEELLQRFPAHEIRQEFPWGQQLEGQDAIDDGDLNFQHLAHTAPAEQSADSIVIDISHGA